MIHGLPAFGPYHNPVPRVLRLLGLWGNGKNVIFLIDCSGLFTVTKLRTVNRRIPAVTIPLSRSQSLSRRRPLTKKPKDSGYEIDPARDLDPWRWPKGSQLWGRECLVRLVSSEQLESIRVRLGMMI